MAAPEVAGNFCGEVWHKKAGQSIKTAGSVIKGLISEETVD